MHCARFWWRFSSVWVWLRLANQGQYRVEWVSCMLFNSLVFGVFFVVVYALYRLLPHRAQNILLLLASYFFYAYWDYRFLSLVILTTAIDYLCGLALDSPEQRHRKLYLTLSVIANLAILGTFKYLGFFVSEANALLSWMGLEPFFPAVNLLLPIGLSFYTFQSMAYSIDIYRGQMRATRSLLNFAVFVAFFPQLVAGPIERSAQLLPQIEKPRRIRAEQLAEGAHLILWGYFKKVFVADNLAIVVQQVYESTEPPSGFLVLVAAYAFTWQIYCDFSGYTDIARGLAKCMGIELSLNFNLPFFATSPRDLWRRWHISLSRWLRDYLYVPLGGNRGTPARTQFNLLATMVLGGLWHGANWTFIVWGAYHGLALAIQRAFPRPNLGPLARGLAIILTFHFTTLGFLIFRAHSMAQVWILLSAMAGGLLPGSGELALLWQVMLVVGPLLMVQLLQFWYDDLTVLMRLPRLVQAFISVALFLAIAVLGASYGRQFIYFQF